MISGRRERYFSNSKRADWHWLSLSLLYIRYRSSTAEQIFWGSRITTFLHLLPRLRISYTSKLTRLHGVDRDKFVALACGRKLITLWIRCVWTRAKRWAVSERLIILFGIRSIREKSKCNFIFAIEKFIFLKNTTHITLGLLKQSRSCK